MKITLNNRHKAGLFITTVVAGLCLILGETIRETIGGIILGFALTWAFGSRNRGLRICIGAIGVLIFATPFFAALIDHHNAVQSYEKSLESFRLKLPEFAKKHPAFTNLQGWTISDSPRTVEFPSACANTPQATQPDDFADIAKPIDVANSFARQKRIIGLPLGAIVKPIRPSRTVAVPNTGDVELLCSMSNKDIAKKLLSYPESQSAPSWYLEALDAGVSVDDINQLTPPLDKPEPFDIKHAISDGALLEVPSTLLAILFFGSVIAEAKRFTGRSNKPVEP